MALAKIIFLLFTISLLLPKSTSNYLMSFCPLNTPVYAPGSEYEANLDTLLHSLSSNATNSGYFSSKVNELVYGLFLCRGDVNTTACSDCVTTATTVDLPRTPCRNSKRAVLWYDNCMVRYSNSPISRKTDSDVRFQMVNTMDTVGNEAGFQGLLQSTLNDTVARTVSRGSAIKFATSEVSIPGGNKTLYILAQCIPDLSSGVCQKCLNDAISILPVKDGARIFTPRCNIRYEIYKFFTTSATLGPALAPAPAVMGNPLGPDDEPLSPTLTPQAADEPLSPTLTPQPADEPLSPALTPQPADEPPSPALVPPTEATNNLSSLPLGPPAEAAHVPSPTSQGSSANMKMTRSYFNFLGGVSLVITMYYSILI